MEAINALIKKYAGAGYIYDIQLVPYCPVRYAINSDGNIQLTNSMKFDYITTGVSSNIVGVIMYARDNSFSFNILKYMPVSNKKQEAMTDFVRLVSPNYNGQFEFSPAKNDGVDYINVDVTYKPYSPYIHLAPNFKGLYGSDYNDARGLICGGDFSIAQATDSWETYQLQNKNYQNSFDRQIQTLDLNNKFKFISDIFGASSGAVSSITSGAVSGLMTSGNPAGAVAGAAVSGGASIVGGVLDIAMNRKLRTDARDLTIDQFGYSLQNIQALPYALTRVEALNANNKIFPFLERYTCTDTEKAALASKLLYDGMTVMRVGTVAEYIHDTPSYIKGRLIRLEGLSYDYAMVRAISDELFQGVYI